MHKGNIFVNNSPKAEPNGTHIVLAQDDSKVNSI